MSALWYYSRREYLYKIDFSQSHVDPEATALINQGRFGAFFSIYGDSFVVQALRGSALLIMFKYQEVKDEIRRKIDADLQMHLPELVGGGPDARAKVESEMSKRKHLKNVVVDIEIIGRVPRDQREKLFTGLSIEKFILESKSIFDAYSAAKEVCIKIITANYSSLSGFRRHAVVSIENQAVSIEKDKFFGLYDKLHEMIGILECDLDAVEGFAKACNALELQSRTQSLPKEEMEKKKKTIYKEWEGELFKKDRKESSASSRIYIEQLRRDSKEAQKQAYKDFAERERTLISLYNTFYGSQEDFIGLIQVQLKLAGISDELRGEILRKAKNQYFACRSGFKEVGVYLEELVRKIVKKNFSSSLVISYDLGVEAEKSKVGSIFKYRDIVSYVVDEFHRKMAFFDNIEETYLIFYSCGVFDCASCESFLRPPTKIEMPEFFKELHEESLKESVCAHVASNAIAWLKQVIQVFYKQVAASLQEIENRLALQIFDPINVVKRNQSITTYVVSGLNEIKLLSQYIKLFFEVVKNHTLTVSKNHLVSKKLKLGGSTKPRMVSPKTDKAVNELYVSVQSPATMRVSKFSKNSFVSFFGSGMALDEVKLLDPNSAGKFFSNVGRYTNRLKITLTSKQKVSLSSEDEKRVYDLSVHAAKSWK